MVSIELIFLVLGINVFIIAGISAFSLIKRLDKAMDLFERAANKLLNAKLQDDAQKEDIRIKLDALVQELKIPQFKWDNLSHKRPRVIKRSEEDEFAREESERASPKLI